MVLEVLQQFGFYFDPPWLFLLLVAELAILFLFILIAFAFSFRVRHFASLQRKRSELVRMRKKASAMIESATGTEKTDLQERFKYLEQVIAKNEARLQSMRKRSWIDFWGLPQGIYFGFKYLLHGLRHPFGGLRKKKSSPAEQEKLRNFDAQIAEFRTNIENLEDNFYDQKISQEAFKKQLFEFKEKIHLLSLEKKKLA